MIAIKGKKMPKGCWYSTKLKLSGVTTCPLKIYCDEKRIKTSLLDARPNDCPLVEITTCKDCKHYYPDEDGRGYHCERDSNVRFSVHRDFYCAGAKRREEK